MSKSKIFFIVSVLLVAGGIIIAFITFSANKKKETIISPTPQNVTTQTQADTNNLLTYEDEAGFTFQYSDKVGVIEKEINDDSVYSSLELLSKNYPNQKIVLKVSDTSLTNVDKWLEKNAQNGSLVNSSGISLSGMKGKTFKYSNPDGNLVLVIDEGILYFIESPRDQGFWDSVFNTVVSSFKLIETKASIAPAPVSAGDGDSSVIDEGEEIIE